MKKFDIVMRKRSNLVGYVLHMYDTDCERCTRPVFVYWSNGYCDRYEEDNLLKIGRMSDAFINGRS